MPCADCGELYPSYVMDFDHRPGSAKLACVGQLVNRRVAITKLLAEMVKADIWTDRRIGGSYILNA